MTGSPGRRGGLDPAVADVRAAVRRALVAQPAHGQRLTVACSGGADSLALASAVAFETARWPVPPAAVVVDHGLQEGSADVAADAATTLRGLRLDPVTVLNVDVPAAGGGGPENRARTARYAALQAVRGGGWVALGHTLDDQAETVLLGLGRGSGPRSLAGMSPARSPWLRPLLAVRRSTTRAACVAEGLPFWDDPHNADPRFARVRLRAEVLPLLEDVLQGGVAAALARTAQLLGQDCAVLDEQADALAADRLTDAAPSVELFADQPAALRRRLLRRWLAPVSGLTYPQLSAVDALVTDWHGQGAVALGGGATVRRASGRLHLRVGGRPAVSAPHAGRY